MNPISTSLSGAVAAPPELARPVVQKGTVSLAHLLPPSINPICHKPFQRFVQNDWSSGTQRVNTPLKDLTINIRKIFGALYERRYCSLSIHSSGDHRYTERRARYQIGHLLGRGTYGVVYEGVEVATKKRVALKIFTRANPQIDAGYELRCLRAWQHFPNVIRLVGSFQSSCINKPVHPNMLYPVIVMPLVLPNLETVLSRKKMEILESLHLLKALLETHSVASNSKKRWMHNDISPSNLSWDNGRLYIYDFSLAREDYGFRTGNGNSVQKLIFRAPEVLMQKAYDASADLWSIGAIMFRAFTGDDLVPCFSDDLTGCRQTIGAIAHRIGIPKEGIFSLVSSSITKEVVSKDMQEWMRFSNLPPLSEALANESKARKIASPIAESFSQLLQRILCYENRISSNDALIWCNQLIADVTSGREEKKQ